MQGYNLHTTQGFTLFDLLVALTVVGILTAVGTPAMTTFLAQQKAFETSQTLAGQMRAARELAVVSGKPTILCGTSDGENCIKNNFDKVMVFVDTNHNYRRDGDEVHLNLRGLSTSAGNLRLAASLGRPYLQYTPEGYANPYGSFYYCPRDGSMRQLIQRITTNNVGRAYIAEPVAAFGEVRKEGASKDAIDCP